MYQMSSPTNVIKLINSTFLSKELRILRRVIIRIIRTGIFQLVAKEEVLSKSVQSKAEIKILMEGLKSSFSRLNETGL